MALNILKAFFVRALYSIYCAQYLGRTSYDVGHNYSAQRLIQDYRFLMQTRISEAYDLRQDMASH